MMQLDSKDKKILAILSVNARATYLEIGKRTRLHKDTVAYRMKRLEQEDIISGYTVFFDFSRLNTRVYKLYVKFSGLNERERQNLLGFLKKEKNVGWIAEGNGSWDMIIGFYTSEVKEFYDFKLSFEQRFHEKIQAVSVTTQIQAYLYSRDYLEPSSREEVLLYSSSPSVILDATDKKILEKISENARTSVMNLSQITRLSARTIAYRINQLEKKKVILQYRCSLNLSKINRIFIKAFIALSSVDRKSREEMITFFREQPCVVHNVESLGEWELEPEFEIENIEEFYHLMSEFRSRFADHIKKIDSMLVSKEHKYQYSPRVI